MIEPSTTAVQVGTEAMESGLQSQILLLPPASHVASATSYLSVSTAELFWECLKLENVEC